MTELTLASVYEAVRRVGLNKEFSLHKLSSQHMNSIDPKRLTPYMTYFSRAGFIEPLRKTENGHRCYKVIDLPEKKEALARVQHVKKEYRNKNPRPRKPKATTFIIEARFASAQDAREAAALLMSSTNCVGFTLQEN